MDYYSLAESHQKSARVLIDNGQYMDAIYHACLAVEMLLKSKHSTLFPDSELSRSHDVIGISRDLHKVHPPSQNLHSVFVSIRKYMNESRYPYDGVTVFQKEFAEEFYGYIILVKAYIDNECHATFEDLQKRFERQ